MNLTEWLQGFAGASPIEWVATICGFLCVYLVIKRSVWCFLFGFIQVSLYSWIFFNVKLYSDMMLHVFYMGFQIYGWLIWSKSSDPGGHIQVNRGSFREYATWVLVAGIATVSLGTFMAANTDASFPYADAFTTCASLVAQWLLSHKKLLNWTLWIIIDIVAIAIYWQKGLYPTSALYFCFLIMSCIGQYQWFKNLQQQHQPDWEKVTT